MSNRSPAWPSDIAPLGRCCYVNHPDTSAMLAACGSDVLGIQPVSGIAGGFERAGASESATPRRTLPASGAIPRLPRRSP